MSAVRPIFVVGCPRSGTTLLTAMLHAHPRIAFPPETRFLLPAYEERERFGDLRQAVNRRKLGEQITGPGTRFGDLRLDRKSVVQAVVDAPPTLGSGLACVWREFARSRGKQRWGEKRPAYWRELDVVLRLFPDAQIIHLVRDPRACVASLRQVGWYRESVPDATALWRMVEREVGAVGSRLPSDSYHRMSFEDLVQDPRPSLRAVCDFLGEEFDEGMLDHADAATDIVPRRKTWHKLVAGQLDPSRITGWRAVLDPHDIGLIERVTRWRVPDRGYRPSGLAADPQVDDLIACAARTARTRAWIAKRRLRDARLRRRFSMPLAACD